MSDGNGKDPDAIDAAIDAGKAAEFPTWMARIELEPAPDGSGRVAVMNIPQDVTDRGVLMLIAALGRIADMAEAKRQAEANAGLVIPQKPRLLRPT